jgi:crotonobetainyl-CoA:carnitine CoA-transferase CaiB-like acyl-CoA transferase
MDVEKVSTTAAALEGVRVLDLSRVLAGPWATQLLADLGARVIKVERPNEGDDTRKWGPPFVTNQKTGVRESSYFLSTNRCKRSICVDVASRDGQQIVRDLAADSEVLIENFKVGALAKYGLDYETLRSLNPGLVYCSITGFGQDGPYRDRPGYDFLVQGMSGLMSVTGLPDADPTKVGVALADVITGLYASNAILAALHHRQRTGAGQHIDIALLDSMVAALANQAHAYLVTRENPPRLGNGHPSIVPYDAFHAADGPIIIAVGNDEQFRRLCEVLGSAELARDPRFASNQQRVLNRVTLTQLLNEKVRLWPGAHWLERLTKAGVPAGPINTLEEAFADPQVRHRRLEGRLPHSALGDVPIVRSPIKLSATPVVSSKPPPMLGEHTREVLRDELQYSDEKIDDLLRRNVIA